LKLHILKGYDPPQSSNEIEDEGAAGVITLSSSDQINTTYL